MTALAVPATELPEVGLGYEFPLRSTEGAPEGSSWSRAEAVPALGGICQVRIEEQAGALEVSQRSLVGAQLLEGACISREGPPSDAVDRQSREGFPPGVGSVAAEMKWVSSAGVHCRSQRRSCF